MRRTLSTTSRLTAVVALACLATACASTVQVKGTTLQSGGELSSGGTTGTGGTTGDGSTGSTTGTSLQGSTSGSGGSGTTGATGGTTGSTSTSGSSTTTGGTSGSATSGTGGTSGGSSASIPTKGPGWDAKNIYLGVPTADDFNSVVKAAGASGSNGDVKGDVAAVVNDINKHGGILGRTVQIAYHDASTTNYSNNPAGTSQEMCTYFTQDRPVVAVVSGFPQLDGQDSFHTCLERTHTTLLALSNTDYGDADYKRLGPHLWTSAALSTDLLIPSLVQSLQRRSFFTGWDTSAGKASKTAPVKVGALLPDDDRGRHVQAVMNASLQKIGLKLSTTFFYDPVGLGQKSQAEVLQMASAGVTHILDLPPVAAEIWFFQRSAEQQNYRPRYGFTSFNLPQAVETNSSIVPPRQQIGSMGVGYQPYNDSNASHDPGPTPGRARCLTALTNGGQKFSSTERRGALIGMQVCDAVYLIRDALTAGKGFDGNAFLRGMPLAGPPFKAAGTFGSTLTSSNHGVPGYYRDQEYQAGCSCFAYLGGNHPFAG